MLRDGRFFGAAAGCRSLAPFSFLARKNEPPAAVVRQSRAFPFAASRLPSSRSCVAPRASPSLTLRQRRTARSEFGRPRHGGLCDNRSSLGTGGKAARRDFLLRCHQRKLFGLTWDNESAPETKWECIVVMVSGRGCASSERQGCTRVEDGRRVPSHSMVFYDSWCSIRRLRG